MKHYILTFALVLICAGCGGKKSYPSSRLYQPSGDFSFVTPDNWFRTKLFGIDYVIVSTEADHGIEPNIYVDFVKPNIDAEDAYQNLVSVYEDKQRGYRIESELQFETESGLEGLKIIAKRKNKNNLSLATYQYLVHDSDRTIAITCTCAYAVKDKYEPIFDQTIKSLKSEKGS